MIEDRRLKQLSLPSEELRLAKVRGDLASALDHLAAPRAICLSGGAQHARKARHARPILRWKVGATVKRLAVRREKHRHWPAAVPGHGLHRRHINLVNIRAFLPIHLDIDEQIVHQGGNLLILEGLTLHHVAPVAGRIPNGKQDRLVFLFGTSQCFVAPGIPVDRVVRVLQQVGARLELKSVCHLNPRRRGLLQVCHAQRPAWGVVAVHSLAYAGAPVHGGRPWKTRFVRNTGR
ncbi:MAG: hypothetical protein KatS3mg060_1319 [Dehalococcoidia bacterium]|nr:MAG: hypothetical protein KatS3mg060_1319 [Dehalococcoidia bacterium]